MSMFLRQRWTDLRLKFDAPDGLTKIELDHGVRHEIWVPDLCFMSDTSANFHDVTVHSYNSKNVLIYDIYGYA
jgi:hypothetical protein